MRRVLALSVVAAVIALLSIGVGGVVAAGPAAAIPGDAPASATAAECDVGDGPDLVGCWNGTHYEDELPFTQTDGLTESELAELTHLTMARVEHVRERPFREDVPVETVPRTEFVNDSASGGTGGSDAAFQRWNDQVWKALFVVGEDESAADAIDSVYGGAVSGFYSPAQDRIVLVVSEGEDPQIDPSTLAHELVHAMQDQYHDLSRPRYVGATQDADLAVDGIIEGEAVHIEEVYDERCAVDWSCLGPPDSSGGGSAADYNFGILQTVLQPYSDGALYVESLVDESGWSAVNETMTRPPNATSEVIHREPDYQTSDIAFEDTATGGWETYPDQGVNGSETAGEAPMFVMFWYQSYEYRHAVLDPDATVRENIEIHTQPAETLRTRSNYNYAHESTDGWAGDELYPYRNDGNDTDGDASTTDGDESTTDGEDGYVWVTEWQTTADATEFRETYLRMLTAHGGDDHTAGEVYDIEAGDFRGAYGVERNGTTVTIAHAPEPADVLELRPDSDLALPSTGDGSDGSDGSGGDDADGSDGDDADGTGGDGTDTGLDGDDGDDGSGPDAATDDGAPGFGVPVALGGLLAAAVLFARRVRP